MSQNNAAYLKLADGTLIENYTVASSFNVEIPDFGRAVWRSLHLRWDGALQATFKLSWSNERSALVDSTDDDFIDSGLSIAAAAASASGVLIPFDNIGVLRARLEVARTATGVLTASFNLNQ